jgi:hypothetical protein
LSKARRLRLLVGTFVLALSVILTGCSGSRTQERKEEDYEKMKMLKKQEEKEKEEKEKSQTGIRTAIAPVVAHQELPGA